MTHTYRELHCYIWTLIEYLKAIIALENEPALKGGEGKLIIELVIEKMSEIYPKIQHTQSILGDVIDAATGISKLLQYNQFKDILFSEHIVTLRDSILILDEIENYIQEISRLAEEIEYCRNSGNDSSLKSLAFTLRFRSELYNFLGETDMAQKDINEADYVESLVNAKERNGH